MSTDPATLVPWLANLEGILGTNWISNGPPRLPVGTIVGNQFRVTAVKKNNRKFQLLIAESTIGSDQPTAGSTYVLKVINPNQVGHQQLKAHLDWIRATDAPEGRSLMLHDFEFEGIHFMVFPKRHMTLRDVLNDETLSPLPGQHVQEFSVQLINAVRHIHRQFSLHGDICPENIELLSDERVSLLSLDRRTEQFVQKNILFCTKIQVAYYGDFGIRSSLPGTDQYRAPEMVFGSKYSTGSDAFSLGCVIAEMVLGEPLFPPCEESSAVYRNEKALLFDAISGQFPEDMAGKIELFYPTIMDMTEVRPIRYSGISDVVQRCLDSAMSIEKWIFDQDDPSVGEVVSGLVRTNPRTRRSLANTLLCDFFHKRYH